MVATAICSASLSLSVRRKSLNSNLRRSTLYAPSPAASPPSVIISMGIPICRKSFLSRSNAALAAVSLGEYWLPSSWRICLSVRGCERCTSNANKFIIRSACEICTATPKDYVA
jgi:hypothetical protein